MNVLIQVPRIDVRQFGNTVAGACYGWGSRLTWATVGGCRRKTCQDHANNICLMCKVSIEGINATPSSGGQGPKNQLHVEPSEYRIMAPKSKKSKYSELGIPTKEWEEVGAPPKAASRTKVNSFMRHITMTFQSLLDPRSTCDV